MGIINLGELFKSLDSKLVNRFVVLARVRIRPFANKLLLEVDAVAEHACSGVGVETTVHTPIVFTLKRCWHMGCGVALHQEVVLTELGLVLLFPFLAFLRIFVTFLLQGRLGLR